MSVIARQNCIYCTSVDIESVQNIKTEKMSAKTILDPVPTNSQPGQTLLSALTCFDYLIEKRGNTFFHCWNL